MFCLVGKSRAGIVTDPIVSHAVGDRSVAMSSLLEDWNVGSGDASGQSSAPHDFLWVQLLFLRMWVFFNFFSCVTSSILFLVDVCNGCVCVCVVGFFMG